MLTLHSSDIKMIPTQISIQSIFHELSPNFEALVKWFYSMSPFYISMAALLTGLSGGKIKAEKGVSAEASRGLGGQ